MASTIGAASAHEDSGQYRLRLFGVVELDGPSPLRFLPERRFRLLAYLALRAAWVGRDELAALFWADRAQDAARSNLRKLLLEVRGLDLPRLESDRNGVRWVVRTDVAEHRAALARGDTDAALALYRGPALLGLDGGESDAFGSWLSGERARLGAAWREAVVAALPRRDPAAALALARLLLDQDPLDEDAMVAALAAHHALGDGHGATATYRGYAERLMEELGIEPSVRVRGVAGGKAGPATRDAASKPPGTRAQATASAPDALSFIGRAQELKELSALLATPGCRLVTVTGPGGVGKSRLVKQAVRDLAANHGDAVHWIALDDLTEVSQIAPRIAVELALALVATQDPVEAIAGHIASRRLLLVLDNSEHLPDVAALLDRLLRAAPRLQVLSTSRSRIGGLDEWLLSLPGLTLPAADGSAQDIAAAEAVQMFAAHARAADPRFDAEANLAQIGRLVRAVGGLPLAILLAASWIRLLPIAELAGDVSQSLDVLESADAGEERAEHRSMRATFELSWRLLATTEQRALAALSIFAGRFSRSAALAVAGAPVVVLSSLVDKSLLQVDTADGAAARFELHPLLRHFARAKRAAVDERRDLSSRHARHFAQWLADTEQALRGAEQPQALAALEQQLPDCHAAWTWALAQRDARFLEQATLPLMYYYEARGRRSDGIALFSSAERALDAGAAAAALAMLARALSTLRYRSGEMALTVATATRGIELARRAGARPALKGCLLNLGLAHYQRGQLDPARACFDEALALARADQDQPGIGAFLNSLAMVEQETGAIASAEAHYREVLGLFREMHNARGMLTALNNLALLLLESKRAEDALPLYEEGIRLGAQHGIVVMRANFLFGLGGARLALGQLPVARDLTRQSLEAAQAGGEPHVVVEAQMQLARIALAGGDPTLALRLAEEALRQAARLENLPVTLDAVHCIAECRLQAGDARGAVALWLFVAAHPQTSIAERQRIRKKIDGAALAQADRAWAEERAQRYELSSLAEALAQPVNEGDGRSSG